MTTHFKLQHMIATLRCGVYVNIQGGKYGNALQAAAYGGNVETCGVC